MGSRTGCKQRYVFHDVSVDEECLRFSNASGFRPSLGMDPELGVDERSRGDRISQSLSQREWNSHDRDRKVHNVQKFWSSSVVTRGSGEAGYLWRLWDALAPSALMALK